MNQADTTPARPTSSSAGQPGAERASAASTAAVQASAGGPQAATAQAGSSPAPRLLAPDAVRLVLIAALDRDHAIGRDNALPWRLSDDLKRFKALTLGKPLLMGRKTAQSLGRALPGRRNLVLTRSGQAPWPGMEAVGSIAQALERAADDGAEALCVIGGGEVYALCLPAATRLHLTWVDTRIEGADAHFPRFDPAQWRETARERHPADARNEHAFQFVDYLRLGMD